MGGQNILDNHLSNALHGTWFYILSKHRVIWHLHTYLQTALT